MDINGDKSISLSKMIPLFNHLLDHCDETKKKYDESMEDETDLLQEAGEAAFDKLLKYYNVSSENATIAVILDPRLKLDQYRKDDTKSVFELQGDIDKKRNQFIDAFQNYKTFGQSDVAENIAAIDHDNEDPIAIKMTNAARRPDELTKYLDELSVAEYKQTDPLFWWKSHEYELPQLAIMARDFLAIPATSAASERAFSRVGQLITDRRTLLTADSVKANLLLQSWIKSGLI